MERIYAFLPSILAIICIVCIGVVAHARIVNRLGIGNLNSVEWWMKNQRKVRWITYVPLVCVAGPAFEELIFRAPFIIAFSAVSSAAWYAIFISSVIFSLTHWFGDKINMREIISARENGEHKSDYVDAEKKRIYAEQRKKTILTRKTLHVVLTLPVGILAAYYGIKYQSIWVAFGIHSAWNLIVAPIANPILRRVV